MSLFRSKISALRTDAIAGWNNTAFRAVLADSPHKLSQIRVPNSSLRRRLFVNPRRIAFKCSFGFKSPLSEPLFQEGEWDQLRQPIEDIVASDMRYTSCREIVLDSVPVHETTEYKELLKRLALRGRVRGFTKERDVASYMRRVAAMYGQIRQEGKLRTSEERGLSRHGGDIVVAIGSDEELLMSAGGNHRFAVAHILGLPAPVQVGAIHKSLIPKMLNNHSSSRRATDLVNRYLEDIQQRYQ